MFKKEKLGNVPARPIGSIEWMGEEKSGLGA